MTAPFSDSERLTIKQLAAGDQTKRDAAVSAFRSVLRHSDASWRRTDPYFAFMSEIDNPCPCYILKSQARAKILGQPWP